MEKEEEEEEDGKKKNIILMMMTIMKIMMTLIMEKGRQNQCQAQMKIISVLYDMVHAEAQFVSLRD